jgi:hypothetical protein
VRLFGSHHPDTLTTHNNLAHWTEMAASGEKVDNAPALIAKPGERTRRLVAMATEAMTADDSSAAGDMAD